MSRFILLRIGLGVCITLLVALAIAVSAWAYIATAPAARPLGQGEGTPTDTPSPTATMFSPLPTPTATETMTSTGGGLETLETIGTLPDLRLPSARGFNVSEQTGAATFDYPLTLPPGPGGFAPHLSISYSSAAVDDIQGEESRDANQYQSGLLGLGWNISGIARQFISDWDECEPGFDCEGQARARIISLSGIGPSGFVELRRDHGWYSTPQPSDWYQSPASNLTFTIHDEYGNNWRTHVTSITDADGTRYEFSRLGGIGSNQTFTCARFGSDGCAREVLGSIYVGKITNVWGQEIRFDYEIEWRNIVFNGQNFVSYASYVYPRRITYGVDQNIKVEFMYYNDNTYLCGSPPYYRCDRGRGDAQEQDLFTDQLLKEIQISVSPGGNNWRMVRKYQFDYWTRREHFDDSQRYYHFTDALGHTIESYHALLKSITEYMCHWNGSTDECAPTGPPHTFYYAQLPFKHSTPATKNDVFLVKVENGYGVNGHRAGVEYTYWNGPFPNGHGDPTSTDYYGYYVWWAREDSTNWTTYDSAQNSPANRWRFLVKQKRVFDGRGNQYDVEYHYNQDNPHFNGLGFVDYNNWENWWEERQDAGFKYLGFPYVRVTTFDFMPAGSNNHGSVLRTEEKTFYQYLPGDGDCFMRDDPRQGLVKILDIHWREWASPIVSHTENTYHFSLLPGSDPNNPANWDRCQRRRDPSSSNPHNPPHNRNFVREPRALLVSTTTSTITFENGGASPVTRTVRTAYEYAWDFTQTDHQRAGNYGALLRTLEYGLDPHPSGYPPDERTTIIYYAHNENRHILNKVKQRCVISGTWPRYTQRWCQAGDPNTYYYYDYYDGLGQVGDRGALTKTEVDIAAGARVKTRQGYDPYGNVNRLWDSNNHLTTRGFDPVFHALPITETNALGQTTTVTYDSDPGSNASTRWGLPISVDGPNTGDTILYRYYTHYDPNAGQSPGQLWKVIKPGDSDALPTQVYSYHVNNSWFGAPLAVQTLTRINAVGRLEEYDKSVDFYDGLGQKLQTQTWTGETGPNGQPPYPGVVTATRYDALGRVTLTYKPYRTTDYASNYSFGQFSPPPSGQPVATTTYDGLGRVLTLTNWEGVLTVRNAYQEGGFKVKTLDARGVMRATWSDGLGRQIQVAECQNLLSDPNLTCPTPIMTTYRYDVLDHLTTVTDALGHVTTITYDLAGRKTAMTDPDMGTWTYEYDPNGNLTHQTDARGQHLCFRYDALNRLRAKGLGEPANCSEFAQYDYDQAGHGQGAIGQRTSMQSYDWGRTDWYYDNRGRVISETHTLWGRAYTLHYTYTPSDQVATVTYPDGEVVTQTYSNQRGLPIRLSSRLATYVSGANYTFYGKLERLTLGNGLQTTYTYDALFRLATLQTGANLQGLAYSYDVSDNVVRIEDTSLAETQSFSYDALNRLATAASSTSSEGGALTYSHRYQYDALGNIDSVIREGTPCDYSYGSQPHAVIAVTCGDVQYSYQYDANGNMVTRTEGEVTYTQQYDAENRLIVVTRTQGTSPEVTRFYYDADGNRVKQVAPDGTITVYIGQWYEESQSLSEGSVRTNYYYFGGQRVAMRRGVAGQAGEVYWLHADHLGSLSEATTASGELSTQQRYYPYGLVRYLWGSMPTTYNYTGQRLDGTGLLYYGARYYAPLIGRFTQADTLVQAGPKTPTPYLPLTVSYTETRLLERWNQRQHSHVYPSTQASQPPPAVDPQSLNRYTYARNSPLAYIDNSGHLAWWVAGGIVGGVGGFVAYALTHQDNFDWGQAALWTAGGAVVGATFGAAAQYVATTVTAMEAASTVGTTATAACADGDCTNEVRITQQLVNQLQAQLQAQGSSFSPDKLVNLAKFQDRIVFLETGGPKAGLQHILERHATDFMNRGISADQISNAIMTAIREGTLVQQVGDAYQFQVIFNGVQQNIQIVIASNGYIVTAHPW